MNSNHDRSEEGSMKENIKSALKVKTTIRSKILLLVVSLGLIVILVILSLGYFLSSNSLKRQAFDQLKSVGYVKTESIQNYYEQVRFELASQAEGETVKRALHDLSYSRKKLVSDLEIHGVQLDAARIKNIRNEVREYYHEVLIKNLYRVRRVDPGTPESYMHNDNEANILQYVYTVKNPAIVGSKQQQNHTLEIATNTSLDEKFRVAMSKTRYAKAHDVYHPVFDALRERFGYYDIYIVDKDGFLVYSNFNQLDFNGNLIYGPQKETGLGRAFRLAMDPENLRGSSLDGHLRITDFKPYPISYDAPASFLSCPIFSETYEKIGALIYQLPVDKINAVMTSSGRHKEIGLGESGEAYLVGRDLIHRTNSRFLTELKMGQKRTVLTADGRNLSETTIGLLKIDTIGARKIFEASLDQQVGTDIYNDYRGIPVLGYYCPVSIKGLDYGLLSEIHVEEAFAPARQQARASFSVGLLALIIFVLVAVRIAKHLSEPISALAETAEKISQGDNRARAPVLTEDEIGCPC